INCPFPAGRGDADYGASYHDLFLPIARKFKPGIVLVSAGYDPHEADPIGGMRVTDQGFAAMCTAMRSLAAEVCGGKLVLFLEGGYDLEALARSVHACLEVLSTQRSEDFAKGVSPSGAAAISDARAASMKYW